MVTARIALSDVSSYKAYIDYSGRVVAGLPDADGNETSIDGSPRRL
jgi:hypothetical protein